MRSIRSRLLWLVLATAIPFIALIGFGLWSQWQNDRAAAFQRTIEEARLLAAQVDDHIGNLENLLTGLIRAVSPNAEDRSANDALLRKVSAELPPFVGNIALFSLDGNNIGASWTQGPRANIADRLHFQRVLAGQRQLAIGDVLVGRVSGELILNVARRVEDQSGKLQAVLAIGTRLEHFRDALRLEGLAAGEVVRIVNERGIVVAHSANGPNWIGRDLSASESIARQIAAKESSEVAVWSDDVHRITGSSTAIRVPWLVSVGLSADTGFAALASRLRWGAVLSSGALFAAFFIAWWFSGRIVRPLRQLGKDASILAAGDLSHRTAIAARDEVGELAVTFNRMADSLERREEEAARSADAVRQANNTLAAVIDASPVAIVCSDLDRKVILWNRGAERLYGYTAEEAIGTVVKMVPPDGNSVSLNLYQRARNGETIRDFQWKRMRKDGSLVDVKIAAAPMRNPDGSVRGVAWAHEDITDAKKAEEQLSRLAHYDPLTGLPNRLSLQKELGRLLAGDCPHGQTSIALFDLDGFKDVNDTLGHSTGDQLLIEVGQRFIEVTEKRSEIIKVCRLGGDEFVVIVPDCGDPCVVGEIVGSILGRLAEPFYINDHALHVRSSAGIAIAPNDGATVDELIANADLALYQVKSDGGHTYRFFLPALRAEAQARRGLDLDLRRAFVENEFEIYFQPQVRLSDKLVVAAEALLRWRHPQRGILAPGAFIETLAESAIAPEVGKWILQTACRQATSWRAMGLQLSRISVNVFPIQLRDEKLLLKDIDDILRETGLPPDVLELEITENVALNHKDAISPLRQLKDMGVQIAFDDFGTGYASLSYLRHFPLSRIKIDRSFVRYVTDNPDDAAIVRSLIAMAHNLGLAVTAEGVETNDQATFLINEQCEEAQGFLYAKPLPAGEFKEYLRQNHLLLKPEAGRKIA